MTQKPFFSIIIPTLNEEKNLPILLMSLAKQKERDFEIIISDSHSTDKTKNIVKEFRHSLPTLLFADKKAKNVSAARNYGASLAKGRFLVFFDADVEISRDFLRKIKEDILIHHLDALTVWNRTKSHKLAGKLILGILNFSMTVFQKIKPAANGPCMIIKKDFFDKVKGFDDEIVFGEDFDIIQKIHRLKAKFAVFETPILYVSTRRFEKEGLLFSLYKSVKALAYQLVFGPIKKPIFNYEMGGQYYEKKK